MRDETSHKRCPLSSAEELASIKTHFLDLGMPSCSLLPHALQAQVALWVGAPAPAHRHGASKGP